MTPARTASESEKLSWPDARLVRECRDGNQEAWSALLDKYKNLIFSIPIKYGFSADEATDIFQAVFLDLLSELPRVREPQALPAWLIRVTSHKCFHWRRQQERYVATEEPERLPDEAAEIPEQMLQQVEREQALRQALRELPPRCRQLVRMLFFETPARPYREIAESLGIATGSIGFIRARCLGRLRASLEKKAFR